MIYLSGLQAWVPGSGETALALQVRKLAHTWSISAEFFLYMLFPLIAVALPRRWSRAAILRALVLTLLAGSALLMAACWNDSLIRTIAPGLPIQKSRQWFAHYSPYVRISEFLAGCLTAALVFRSEIASCKIEICLNRALVPLSIALVAIGTWVTSWASTSLSTQTQRVELAQALMPIARPLLVLGVCGFVYALITQDGWHRRMLSHRLMVGCGDCSYSIYLLHPLLLSLFLKTPEATLTAGGVVRFLIVLTTACLVIIVFSYGSYCTIERPARQWLRQGLLGASRQRMLGAGVATISLAALLTVLVGPGLAFPLRQSRQADLQSLRGAIEAHRRERGSFPLASSWSGFGWPNAAAGTWLPGLAPTYLPELPRDPRMTNIQNAQYVYKSDGRDFKLLALESRRL